MVARTLANDAGLIESGALPWKPHPWKPMGPWPEQCPCPSVDLVSPCHPWFSDDTESRSAKEPAYTIDRLGCGEHQSTARSTLASIRNVCITNLPCLNGRHQPPSKKNHSLIENGSWSLPLAIVPPLGLESNQRVGLGPGIHPDLPVFLTRCFKAECRHGTTASTTARHCSASHPFVNRGNAAILCAAISPRTSCRHNLLSGPNARGCYVTISHGFTPRRLAIGSRVRVSTETLNAPEKNFLRVSAFDTVRLPTPQRSDSAVLSCGD